MASHAGPDQPGPESSDNQTCSRVCPVCGGLNLIEIRHKLHCERCHSIIETCCEGGRG